MYEVSNDYLAVANSLTSREFYIRCKFDGLSEYLTYKHIANGKYTNIIDGNSILSMGNACSNKIDLTIRNFNQQHIWEDSRFTVEKGLLVLGEIIWIPWGTFWVVDMSTSNDGRTLYLTAYDYMYKLSKTKYHTKLTAPFHYMDLLNEFLTGAGMTLADGVELPDASDADYTILSWPDEAFYYSDIAGHLAGMIGMNARVSWADPTIMEFTWYTPTGTKVKDTLYQDGFEKLADSVLRVDYLVTGTNKKPDPETSDPDDPEGDWDSDWDIVIENDLDITDGELDFSGFDIITPNDAPRLLFTFDDANLTASVSANPDRKYDTDPLSIPYAVNNNGTIYTVTSIPKEGFTGCQMSELYLPRTLTSIGDWAFLRCTNIETVYWSPISLSKAGTAYLPIFAECPKITTIVIDNGVTIIPDNAFVDCSKVTHVSIPETVTSFGKCAFKNSGIVSIEIPAGVTSIGDQAFSGCKSLQRVYWYATSISKTSKWLPIFEDCSNVVGVFIGNKVKRLPENMLIGCGAVKDLTVPESVETIGKLAFSVDTLEYIIINKDVDSISGSPWGAANATISWTGEINV